MSRDISQSTREEITAPQSGVAFLTLVELSSVELPSTLYFVQNNVNITSNGQEYTAANFKVNIPSQEESTAQETSLTISGIDRVVIEAVRSVTEAVDFTMNIVREDTPDVTELGPFNFKLRGVAYDTYSVTGSLLYEYTLRNNISSMTITSQNFPGLF